MLTVIYKNNVSPESCLTQQSKLEQRQKFYHQRACAQRLLAVGLDYSQKNKGIFLVICEDEQTLGDA